MAPPIDSLWQQELPMTRVASLKTLRTTIYCRWFEESDVDVVSISDFDHGKARYLHTNCRVNPRVGAS